MSAEAVILAGYGIHILAVIAVGLAALVAADFIRAPRRASMNPEHRANLIISQATTADGDQIGQILDEYKSHPEAFRRALNAANTTDATIALTMLAIAHRIEIADNTYRSALVDAVVGETCRRWIRSNDYRALTAVWYAAHGQPDFSIATDPPHLLDLDRVPPVHTLKHHPNNSSTTDRMHMKTASPIDAGQPFPSRIRAARWIRRSVEARCNR